MTSWLRDVPLFPWKSEDWGQCVPLSAPFETESMLACSFRCIFLVKGKCTGDKDAGNYTVKGRICLAPVKGRIRSLFQFKQRQNTSCQANVTSFGGKTRKNATKCKGILWARNFSSHRRVAAIGWCSRLLSNLKLRSLFLWFGAIVFKGSNLTKIFQSFSIKHHIHEV